MSETTPADLSVGWIGTGRMGFALAGRLARLPRCGLLESNAVESRSLVLSLVRSSLTNR